MLSLLHCKQLGILPSSPQSIQYCYLKKTFKLCPQSMHVPVVLQLSLYTQVPLTKIAELKQDLQTVGLPSSQEMQGSWQLSRHPPIEFTLYPGTHLEQTPAEH